MSKAQTVLAFDYGEKRIGVAVGQTLTHTATALEILPSTQASQLWSALDRLVREWQPDLFVLGKPLHADATETPLFAVIKDFGNQLHARYNRQVQYIDERLSSNAAQNLFEVDSERQVRRNAKPMRQARRNHDKHIDHVAAKLILESWFSEMQQGKHNTTEQ